jgi:hypothetical protein
MILPAAAQTVVAALQEHVANSRALRSPYLIF